MSSFTMDDVVALRDAVRLISVELPEAYLRDRVHLETLEAFSRAVGREPRYPSPVDAARFGGIPIFLDPDLPENVLELRWPDGRVERVPLPGTPVPPHVGLGLPPLERLIGIDGRGLACYTAP